jgi:hypothetical protein
VVSLMVVMPMEVTRAGVILSNYQQVEDGIKSECLAVMARIRVILGSERMLTYATGK